jgi:hypothetical protein
LTDQRGLQRILQGLSHLYSFDGQVFAVKVHQERTKRIQKTVLSY